MVVPRQLALTRAPDVPATDTAALEALLDLDLQRRAPFRPGKVGWTYAVDAAGRVRQWLVRRSDAEALKDHVEARGFQVRRLVLEGAPASRVLFAFDAGRPGRFRVFARVNAVLAAACLAVTAAWSWQTF